jgi:hypothetical protein
MFLKENIGCSVFHEILGYTWYFIISLLEKSYWLLSPNTTSRPLYSFMAKHIRHFNKVGTFESHDGSRISGEKVGPRHFTLKLKDVFIIQP